MLAVPVTTINGNNALDEAAETSKKKVRASVPKLGCSTHANISAVSVYCPVQYNVICDCIYVCMCVCVHRFLSLITKRLCVFIFPSRASAWSTLAFISHNTMIDSTWKKSDWELPFKHTHKQTNTHTYTSPTSPVSSVDCRLARYLFWYLFQHWRAFTSMLMILVYVFGFLLHFPLNTRELIPLSISFTRKPRLATTQQTSDRKPTRKQTKTQANTRQKNEKKYTNKFGKKLSYCQSEHKF